MKNEIGQLNQKVQNLENFQNSVSSSPVGIPQDNQTGKYNTRDINTMGAKNKSSPNKAS